MTLHLSRLTLSQFRSHPRVQAAFDGRPVALFGDNGADKTNLLEAVSLLSPGRGLRRAAPEDLIGRQAGLGWRIEAELQRNGTPHELLTEARPDQNRSVRIDGLLRIVAASHDQSDTADEADQKRKQDLGDVHVASGNLSRGNGLVRRPVTEWSKRLHRLVDRGQCSRGSHTRHDRDLRARRKIDRCLRKHPVLPVCLGLARRTQQVLPRHHEVRPTTLGRRLELPGDLQR